VAVAGSNTYIRALFACVIASLAVLLLPATQAKAAARMDNVERAIVRKLNKIRAAHGLPRFRTSRSLARAADFHCKDMIRANFFAHPSSNGQDMATRVESFRHSSQVGETLAYVPTGSGSQASTIVSMWMHSPPHRAALLTGSFTRIGVARRTGTLGSSPSIVFTADLGSAR
jgi:uncharacterized protein YkwD